jgi:hypothetical protein
MYVKIKDTNSSRPTATSFSARQPVMSGVAEIFAMHYKEVMRQRDFSNLQNRRVDSSYLTDPLRRR